jgi:hypothetical protein
VRTREAIESAPSDHLAYCVLTFEQRGHRRFYSPIDAYKGLGDALAKLVRALRRAWPNEDLDYVATVERHKSGWPHLNVIFRSQSLAEYVQGQIGEDHKADDWLRMLQRSAGFGPVAWWEPVRSQAAIADYLSKVAGEFLAGAGRLSSEVVKLTQLPLNAPVRMRRIRSSKGFLPKARRERKCYAGILLRGKGDIDGDASTPLDPTSGGVDTVPPGEWTPESGSRVFYQGHLNRRGLEVDENWLLVASPHVTHDSEQFDDRAAIFGSVRRIGEQTREQRAWLNGHLDQWAGADPPED